VTLHDRGYPGIPPALDIGVPAADIGGNNERLLRGVDELDINGHLITVGSISGYSRGRHNDLQIPLQLFRKVNDPLFPEPDIDTGLLTSHTATELDGMVSLVYPENQGVIG
jgi:hypothetical protein